MQDSTATSHSSLQHQGYKTDISSFWGSLKASNVLSEEAVLSCGHLKMTASAWGKRWKTELGAETQKEDTQSKKSWYFLISDCSPYANLITVLFHYIHTHSSSNLLARWAPNSLRKQSLVTLTTACWDNALHGSAPHSKALSLVDMSAGHLASPPNLTIQGGWAEVFLNTLIFYCSSRIGTPQ